MLLKNKTPSSSLFSATHWLRRGLLTACCALAPSIHAETLQLFSSDAEQTHLLELFTSEGCNSCPPADQWMSALKKRDVLWTKVIPVAWHVDYWDNLGWRDEFAQPSHTARQYGYAEKNQTSGVYTPGLMLDGKEFRQWRNIKHSQLEQVAPLNRENPAGKLELAIDNNTGRLTFTPADANVASNINVAGSKAYIVLLGMDIKSPVAKGENKGKTLHHDFVVLASATADLVKTPQGYQAILPTPSSLKRDASNQRATKQTSTYAVAAWITDNANKHPIQAVGGLLTQTDN